MSSGERAGEEVKGVFKGIGDASESIRKNVNSFADDLIGNKSGTHANTADRASGASGATGSTGIHPDARKAGEEARQGVNKLGQKMDDSTSSTNRGNAASS